MDEQTDGQKNRQRDGQTDGHSDGQANGWTNRQMDRQTDKQTSRQTDEQTNKSLLRTTDVKMVNIRLGIASRSFCQLVCQNNANLFIRGVKVSVY